MPTKLVSFRLPESTLAMLREYAEAADEGLTATLVSLIPSGLLGAIIRARMSLGAETQPAAAALLEIVADGLRWEMTHHIRAVDPHFIVTLTPAGVLDYYLKFLQAVDDAAGIRRPDGKPSAYYFAKPPAGGEWERIGVKGWAALSRHERFTSDGIEWLASDGETCGFETPHGLPIRGAEGGPKQ